MDGWPKTAESLEFVRRLAVRRLADGWTADEVCEFLDVSPRSLRRWRSAAAGRPGAAGLAAKAGRGRPPKLDAGQARLVASWLARSPTEFGFATERWTAPRVASVVARELGVGLNHRYLNDWLRRHGVTPQVPERRPYERDPAAVAARVRHRWPVVKKRRGTSARPCASRTRPASCSRR